MNITDVTFFVLLNVVVFGGLLWIANPFYLFLIIYMLVIPSVIKIHEIHYNFFMFKNKERVLIDIKHNLRWNHLLAIITEWMFRVYLYCYKHVSEELRTKKMEWGYNMAIRAVDNRRRHGYVLEEERITKDDHGDIIKGSDDKPKLISVEDALEQAEQKGLTVFWFRGRTARGAAEERDRMLEVHTKGGEIVQRVHSGTIDFNTLINGLTGCDRFLAPEGKCVMCDIDHTAEGHTDSDDYFVYEKLISFAKEKRGAKGAMANEVLINHLTDPQRQEIASYMRSMGTDRLGEN